jgi:serine/threonine protein kinase
MMGVVYEAHDPALSRSVALKTINPSFAASAEDRTAFERRFETDARIAGRLSHPNIVVVHDVGRDEETGILYIALERLHGEPLSHLVRSGERLPWEEVMNIGVQVADALQHLHSEGVVHRDIKPANVMRLPRVPGQLYRPVKLMDFGIAKLDAAQLTAAGQFFGTPLYMAPEQASNETVDARSDVFSLGSVLYTLLTGRHAFAANNVIAILQRVVNEDPTPPSVLDPTLPPAIDEIVARCLCKDPGDRYPDAHHLADDLADTMAGKPLRHRKSWTKPPARTAPPVVGSLEPMPESVSDTLTVDGTLEESARTRGVDPAPSPTQRPRRLGLYADLMVVVVVAAIASWVLLRPGGLGATASTNDPEPQSRPPAASVATQGAADAPASVAQGPPIDTPSPNPATPVAVSKPAARPAPAQIVLDIRHPFRRGSLRVDMDEKPVMRQTLIGKVDKKLLFVKTYGNVLTDLLEATPGRHVFDVEVSWDDNTRRERIHALFRAGETYRLEIRIGRLRKNLSLKWTR